MKRMLLTLAVLGLGGMSSRADWGGFAPPMPQNGGGPVQPARGEFSSPNTLMGLGAGQPGHAPDRYGLMPGLRHAFRIGGHGCSTCTGSGKAGLFSKFGSGTCSTCNSGPGLFGHGGNGYGHAGFGHGGNGGGGYDYPQYPPMNQGTLVFPNHQFVRSPRDFFMYEPGR